MKAPTRFLRLTCVLLPLLLPSGAALADDVAIVACRTLSDTGARLACYDAIKLGARPAAPALAAPEPGSAANFGMETVKRREAEPVSVTSTVVGDFDGWGPGTQIRLANGQVWRIIDGSEAVLPRKRDARVTIERNLFGTLFLKVEGSNSSAKVRRMQ
ncbi:hypothetical protein [Massilia sp. H6]|uniref:hypothetical protein n=1 Tax=Massilia sp. H6 TaxID=2970464 RepID=UPI0021691E5C|nr:hypothetical protein [Massilia sp. H6]UVW27216.1 hypothetical protein NRS07_11630 [Massilia sp. H6]